MVKRRKVLIGAGSLLAGGAAATGTGALSSTEVDRTATGEIVGDADAYIRMIPYGENEDFASTENGQLVLDFSDGGKNAPLNNQGPSNGEGLNADSINKFDQVFRIAANDNGGEFDVWIKSHSDHLRFYWSSKKTGYTYKSNSVRLSVGGNTNVDVGVEIDLEDVDQPQKVLTGNNNFTVHADDV